MPKLWQRKRGIRVSTHDHYPEIVTTSLPAASKQKLKKHQIFLWILTISLAVKLMLWLFILLTDSRRFIDHDSKSYQNIAIALLKTGMYAISPERAQEPETNRMPGYPTFLAILYRTTLVDPSIAILAQIVISTVSGALVYWIAISLWGEKTALLAALLFVLDLGFLAFSLVLLTETLFSFLLLCVFAMLIPALQPPYGGKFAFLTGLFLALATMVRPIGYYLFAPLLIGLIILGLRNHQGWRSLRAPAYFLFPLLLIVGGWQTRNYLLTGYGTFSRIQGELLLRKSAEIVAARDKITFEDASKRIADEQKKRFGSRDKQSLEKIDRFWVKEGALYLMKYPSYYLKREARRSVRVFVPAGNRMISLFGPVPGRGPFGDLRRLSAKKYVNRWVVRRSVLFFFTILMVLHLCLLYAGAFIAIWLSWKKHPVRAIHIFYAVIFLYFLVISLAIGFQSRFLLPAIPLLHLYTARTITLLKDRKPGLFHKFARRN